MGIVTYIFIALALINGISCAPVNDSTAKPPAISLFGSTTEIIEHPVDSKRGQVPDSKYGSSSSSSSEESKESAPSSEVTKTRLVRDNGNSGAIAHQTKDLPQGAILTPPAVTKEPLTHQLPARKTRETNEPVAAPAILYAGYGSSSTTSSTPASTTSA